MHERVPSKVIRPNVRTVNFGCYVRKAERGCSNTKGYNRAGKRLEHPTPVHKKKSVWLYTTHPSMRSSEEQEQPSTVGG